MHSKKQQVVCPECEAPMKLHETKKYKYGNGNLRKFYGCTRWPQCKGTHGAHPDGSPLGIPADKTTKQARIRAHEAFDSLREIHGVKKPQAYYWLGAKLGIPFPMIRDECHIAKFDLKTCEDVIRICVVRE